MSMVQCQLWMGGLEPYMTESFILASFERMGEKPLNVKVMRNKYTGEPAGYCFVHFENDDEAIDAMHKLNGKLIPNTNPPIRFRLNTATNQGKVLLGEKEFSLWVGDLSPEVDDYTLFKTFAGRYQSIKAAKVILDTSGFSKGFGFLRFGSEEEQKHCLTNMNGFKGLGTKAIKISNAIPKYNRTNQPMQNMPQGGQGYPGTQDYSHYYDPATYWQNYAGWSNYYDTSGGQTANYAPYNYMMPTAPAGNTQEQSTPQYQAQYQYQTPAPPPPQQQAQQPQQQQQTDPDLELVDHPKPSNLEEENVEKAESICSFWDALQNSKWTSQELFESDITKIKFTLVEI